MNPRRTRAFLATLPDGEALTAAPAERIVTPTGQAATSRHRLTWVLAGGSAPKRIYALISTARYAARVDWQRVHFFWGHERCLPPNDSRSNYAMARTALLGVVAPPDANVHRMEDEEDPVLAAAEYEAMLHRFFEVSRGGSPPCFDLVLLGTGANGRTASIFPGTPPLFETERWVMPNYIDDPTPWCITMTPGLINAAAHVRFLISGAERSERLREVLQGDVEIRALPPKAIQPTHGDLLGIVDADAASCLGVAMSIFRNAGDHRRPREERWAAERATELTRSGLVLGLRAGRTACFAVATTGRWPRVGRLPNIVGVPCSSATENEARRRGVKPTALEEHPGIDLSIHGADGVNPELSLIKDGGGAPLCDRIVAQASARESIAVNKNTSSKVVGTDHTLPVGAVPFARRTESLWLEPLGARVSLRRSPLRADQDSWSHCQTIGGESTIMRRLDPIFAALAPGPGIAGPASGRPRGDAPARACVHCGSARARHFVKIAHNGTEYGLMAAWSGGLSVLRHTDVGNERRKPSAERAPLHHPEHYRYELNLPDIAEAWRHGRVTAPWLLDLAAALFQRFSSRGESQLASKVLSALRLQFVAHAEERR